MMASLFYLITIFFSVLPFSTANVKLACKTTRFPQICEESISNHHPPKPPTPIGIIKTAISVSANRLHTARKMVGYIKHSSTGNLTRSTAVDICVQTLDYATYRTDSTADALPRGEIKDARAWFTAALAYQYDCWSILTQINDTKLINNTISVLYSLVMLTSNGLSMIWSLDNFGSDLNKWTVPKTERNGFWEKRKSGGETRLSFGGVPRNLKISVTVCKNRSCDYRTVQAAVNAAPTVKKERKEKFVIYIKAGSYKERIRVPFDRKNVVFLGDGIGKTVITGSAYSGQAGITTYESATVGVLGDGFMAANLTFANTAEPVGHQAVAFRSDSDLSVIENCEFLGNQDTLYAKSLRQFYKNCRIQGNVDFIFGNAAAVFQDCVILIAPKQLKKPEQKVINAITAHGRVDPAQASGFVFQNCVINGTEEYMQDYNKNPQVHKNYLGRPWKEYCRTVFLNCWIGEFISPEGWLPWSGDLNLKTLYYGELGNSGPGSNRSKRVSWSNQIPAKHVDVYSLKNFIQGDKWIPSS